MSDERRQSRRQSRHSLSNSNNRSSTTDNNTDTDNPPPPPRSSSRSRKSVSFSNQNTTYYMKDDNKENETNNSNNKRINLSREECYYGISPLAIMGDMQEAAEDYTEQSLMNIHQQLITLAYAARKKYQKTKQNKNNNNNQSTNRRSSTGGNNGSESHIFDHLSHEDIANLLTDAIDSTMDNILEQSKIIGQQWEEKYHDPIFKIPESLPSISNAALILSSPPFNQSINDSSAAITTSPPPSTIPSIPLYVDGYKSDTDHYHQSIEESSVMAAEEESIDEQISSLYQQIQLDTVETEKLKDLSLSYQSLWSEYEKNIPKELIDLFNSSPPFSPSDTKQLSQSIKSAIQQVKILENTVRSYPQLFDNNNNHHLSSSSSFSISPSSAFGEADSTTTLDNDFISNNNNNNNIQIDPNFDS